MLLTRSPVASPPPISLTPSSLSSSVRAHRLTSRPPKTLVYTIQPCCPRVPVSGPDPVCPFPQLSKHTIVFFFGLNTVRVVGIISLILVFASSILVMVKDVVAVNDFLDDAKTSGTPVDQLLEGCDYIECAPFPFFFSARDS